MQYQIIKDLTNKMQSQKLISLFKETFTDSEGGEEGNNIATLVSDFLDPTNPSDLLIATAWDQNNLVGAVLFSPLYSQDNKQIYLMAPVGVSTEYQGRGIGQGLISFAMKDLKSRGVDLVITYGDINFYSKTGFRIITEDQVPPPLPLTYPQGWLGQSLRGEEIPYVQGPTKCAEAINDPLYW